MTLEELTNAIQKEIVEISEEQNVEDSIKQEEMERYKAGIESLKIKRVKDLDKIKMSEIVILYLHSIMPEVWSIEEVEKITNSSLKFFENSTSDEFDSKSMTLIQMVSKNILTRLQKKKIDLSNISKLKKEDLEADLQEDILTLQHYEKEGIDVKTLLPFIAQGKECVIALSIVNFFKCVKEYGQKELETYTEDDLGLTRKEKERALVNAMYNMSGNIKINDIISILREHLIALENSQLEQEKRSKRVKALKASQNLVTIAMQEPVITNYQSIIRQIPIPELKLETLKLIYSHNLNYQEQIEKRYQELTSKKEVQYQEFAKAFDLPTDNIEDLMKKPLEDLKAMYPLLVSLGIKDQSRQEELLRISTLSRLSGIKILQNKGMISPNFLTENNNLFCEDKKEFEDLTKNIGFLLSLKLRPTIISKHSEILLSDPDVLSENLRQLQEYELPIDWSKNQDISFLTKPNIENKIDRWLELGYETLLEHHLELLNYSRESIKRLEVLKEIRIPLPETKEDLKVILDSPTFIIPEQEIDTYIQLVDRKENKKEINPSLEAILKPLESTKRTYQVEGNIFSKRKTLRNLSQEEEVTQDTIVKSMITGTNLLLPEVEKVRNSLQGYNYRKQ